MVLGRGAALKGCASRTGEPASALDRDAATKRVAVMAKCAATGFRLTPAPSCEDVIRRKRKGSGLQSTASTLPLLNVYVGLR
jgi:hypothetical protein